MIDGAPLHKRCATITRAHCKAVREKLQAGLYIVLDWTQAKGAIHE